MACSASRRVVLDHLTQSTIGHRLHAFACNDSTLTVIQICANQSSKMVSVSCDALPEAPAPAPAQVPAAQALFASVAAPGASSATPSTSDDPSALLELARMIRRGESIVVVTGSGLSAPSGIPTFRGTGGVWAKFVLEWGTRAAFLDDPRAWWNKFWIPAHVVAEPGSTIERSYDPSAGHYAVAQLSTARNANVRVITQNIDGLHARAGLPSNRLVEVHGTAGMYKCVSSGCRYARTESIPGAPLDLRLATAASAPEAVAALAPTAAPAVSETMAPATAASMEMAEVDGCKVRPEAHGAGANNSANGGEDGATARLAEVNGSANAPQTVVGELPRCPACAAPSLPQCLLFDEDYESHTHYQFRKARRWLESAKGIVFIGTSFAVGITEQALCIAEENSLPTFSFNIRCEEPLKHEASTHEPLPCPVMRHVIGPCELTLPKLADLVAAPIATSTADWYRGWIPPDLEAAALAGRGSEWSEATSGEGRSSRGRRGKKRNREKSVPRHETTWVACDACGKWRKLPPGVAGPPADERWRCAQNVGDPARRSCKVPEEPWG